MPLPCYISRYPKHSFFTLQHALVKTGKSIRLIFDAAKHDTATSTLVNMMTLTYRGTELYCKYGDTLLTVLEHIWDLRSTYLLLDIIIHANDVKSCFQQMKLHPDILAAFTIMVADFLFLQLALPFSTYLLPQNWKPVCWLIEVFAEKLFKDDTPMY